MDCQKTGSGFSIVATLNALSLALIGLNALFMFCGAWMKQCRVISTYCTFFTCLFLPPDPPAALRPLNKTDDSFPVKWSFRALSLFSSVRDLHIIA